MFQQGSSVVVARFPQWIDQPGLSYKREVYPPKKSSVKIKMMANELRLYTPTSFYYRYERF